ncbi:MAG TPA: PD-(D/E)XK nuclease family protein [Opitutaceae bacterium]|nr:PD-(D/E)XK nuclease family protein [Opitutaceae bacterium]
MEFSPANLRRHFIPWDAPLLPQAAAWLAGDWDGARPLDLQATWVVVPTRQSGRRLREALAEFAAARGQAVFPPRVLTADALLATGSAAPDVATRLESLLAWAEVLREIDLAAVPEVFPVAPPRRDLAWAWRLAENFFRLQTQLTEGGLGFGEVVAHAGAAFPETERWHQLAQLEAAVVEKLAARGRRESHAARRAWAREPVLPPEIRRVVLLASPDPLPLALAALARWAERVPVEVVVFAPESEADHFDAWGRPLDAAWAQRVLALPEFERRVQLCADPTAEAERAARVVQGYGAAPDGLVALGVADADALPLLESSLTRTGVASYNPEGRPWRTDALHTLLVALAALRREPTFDAVAALARCPDFLAALVARGGATASAARWLQALDELRAEHLPADLRAAREHASAEAPRELPLGLELIAELRAVLEREAFPAGAATALGILFRGRQFDLSRPDDARAAEAAEAWRGAMRECLAAGERFGGLRAHEWWDIALRSFGESRRTEDKPAGALELQGWLELLWEDAPHLVVTGVNDGFVPDAVIGDAFLPEALRERLGLKTNAARFARDAYVFQAIAACRARHGRLDVLFAKNSALGEPLRPSRLLLRCADAELPARVAFLFRPVEAAPTNRAWTRAWKLAPRRAPPPARVAVTGLRTWLACPFRFYLAQVLRMEPVDADKSELDARDFGTLCHAALEAMAREPALRDCTEEKTLREFLLARFEAAARARFGAELTLPLVVQLESARQRLAKAAAVQARERAAGWTIERAEWKFALPIGGLEVRGKIDRLDRHEPSGRRRVLDYKTSDTAIPPHKAHVRPFRPGDERLPEWMQVTHDGRRHVWADLQLPLYLRALDAENLAAGPSVDAGYFNLPKAVGETAVAVWSELTPELRAAADACADGAAAAIRAGEFWPPAELAPERDAFAALFQHGAADSVAWEVAR